MSKGPSPDLGMCKQRVYLVSPVQNITPCTRPGNRKNGMGAINTNISDTDGAHGMLTLPQNTKSALNRISSEPGLLKIPCAPWHMGRDRAWAKICMLMVPMQFFAESGIEGGDVSTQVITDKPVMRTSTD